MTLFLPDEAPTAPATYRWATVTQTDPLTIRLDGDQDPLPVKPDTLVDPATLVAGRRVWVQFYGRRLIIVGAAPGPEPAPWLCTLKGIDGQSLPDNAGQVLDMPTVYEDPRGMADTATDSIVLGRDGYWVVDVEATIGNNGAGYAFAAAYTDVNGAAPTVGSRTGLFVRAYDYRELTTWRTTLHARSAPTFMPAGTRVWGVVLQNSVGAITTMGYQDTPRLSTWLYHG